MTMYTESLRAFLKPVVPYLDDETVTEIMINGPEDVWIERKGRVFKTDARFSEEGLLGAARNMAQFVGRLINDERPRLDARLPDGSRIHVVLPPIARRGCTISIRKFFKDRLTIDGLKQFRSITEPMARLLECGIHLKLNMVVSGGTGSGKTTLLNVISSLIPNDERILTIEDSAELQLSQDHLVSFESRPADKFGKGEINMGDLLHSALRLRPDRIVVGEVRGGEAFHLMQAMNTGHGGSLSTCHANTPTDTLRRLESLCLMSAVELPMVAVRAQVASAINMIVCCERLHDGTRKLTHISEVLPLNDRGEYRTQDLWVFTPIGKDADGNILGYHAPTGILPSWLGKARAYGFGDLDEKYFDPATYGLPPPPVFNVGEDYTIRWASSLKHREKNLPDPDDIRDQFRDFERKLKEEAAQRAPSGPSAHAPAPAPAPKPIAAKPTTPPAPVAKAAPPKPTPPPSPVHDDDKTPPPTMNPLRSSAPSVPDEADIETASGMKASPPMLDEAKVEISDDLLSEVEELQELQDRAPAPPPRRPAPPPARPQNAMRPAGVPPRRPAPPPPVKLDEVDDGEPPEIADPDKTHIKAAPTGPKVRR